MELVYKYNYGTEDIPSANITIYKEKDEYTLVAEFEVFDKISLPKIKTIYKILDWKEEENNDEEGLINHIYKIKVLGINNPPPEKLFIIN